MRASVAHPIVLGGGAEAFEGARNRAVAARPHFVFIGTVQLRKQHFLVLDLFEKLWAAGSNVRLTFVGEVGNVGGEEVDRLERLSSNALFCWERKVGDGETREILASATALLLSEHARGTWAPPLEALRVGVPVIVSRDLPALEFVPNGAGVLAIEVTFENLENAVMQMLDPDFAERKRREIDPGALLTWNDVACRAAAWIYGAGAAVASAGFPLAERVAAAKAIHVAVRHDGAACVDACFGIAFGRRPIGSELAAWNAFQELFGLKKLDLLLSMASSDDCLKERHVANLQKLIDSRIFYQECDFLHPGLEIAKRVEALNPLDALVLRLMHMNDEEFADNCYLELLRRAPDAQGRRNCLATLRNAPDRRRARRIIIMDILGSKEWAILCSQPSILRRLRNALHVDLIDKRQRELLDDIENGVVRRYGLRTLLGLRRIVSASCSRRCSRSRTGPPISAIDLVRRRAPLCDRGGLIGNFGAQSTCVDRLGSGYPLDRTRGSRRRADRGPVAPLQGSE